MFKNALSNFKINCDRYAIRFNYGYMSEKRRINEKGAIVNMKKYRSYNGDKPYIFVTYSENDEQNCELLLDQLVPIGYRVRVENKGAASSATLCDLECARVMLFVLTEGFIADPPCYRLLQKAEELHRPLIAYVPVDTPAVKEVLMRLIRSPDTTVIIRPGEEALTDSKTVNVLLDPTLGLTPALATKVFNQGIKMLERGNSDAGMEYIKLSADENCAEAILWLGKQAIDEIQFGHSNYETAVKYLFDAARLGSTEAMYILGKMLKNGEGFDRNPQLAYTYVLKSAQHGFAPAQAELAYMYDHGIGTELDKTLATKWYMTAAEKGETASYLPLGIRYLEGIYVEKDGELAERYLIRSAAGGCADAELMLAKLYKEGTELQQDIKRSNEHFKNAAEAGLCEAQYFYALAILELKGMRRRERNKQAFYWLKRASDDRIDGSQGSPDAMFKLGNFYQRGKGCKKDLKKAFITYYSAAKLGHNKAVSTVAECYKKGIGVQVNKKAAKLFKKRAQALIAAG